MTQAFPASSNLVKRAKGRPRILVLGLGNTLFSDDGIGVELARIMQRQARVGVLVTEIGTAILSAVPLLEWADRVLVLDAMQGGKAPGSVYFGAYGELSPAAGGRSLHERSFGLALELSRPDKHPLEICVLGIEPECVELGLSLSKTLRDGLPRYLAFGEELVQRWRLGARPRGPLGLVPRSRPAALEATPPLIGIVTHLP